MNMCVCYPQKLKEFLGHQKCEAFLSVSGRTKQFLRIFSSSAIVSLNSVNFEFDIYLEFVILNLIFQDCNQKYFQLYSRDILPVFPYPN